MKRLGTVALAFAIALPICAQRGGHAGFASRSAGISHAGPVFRGGGVSFASPRANFSPSMPIRYPGIAPAARYPVAAPLLRPTFYHRGPAIGAGHRFFIRSYPVVGYPYSSYVVGYLPPDLLDNEYDDEYNGYDNYGAYQQPAPQPDQGYDSQLAPQPDYGYPPPEPQPEYGYAYPQPQPAPQPLTAAAPETQYTPGPADTVTLIFKDGRPPEQIQNYIATGKTLTIIDGSRHRDVPIADLDVPATIQANRDTGVGFQLPTATP